MKKYINDLPEIYKEKSIQDKGDEHQLYYDHRKRLKNDRVNICNGNLIKGNSIKPKEEKKSSNRKSRVEKSYEDKVNEILEQSGLNSQSSIDDIVNSGNKAREILQQSGVNGQSNIDEIVQKETRMQEILRKNNNQTKVNKFIEER